jgi:uncharacterized spore protein YtfJ
MAITKSSHKGTEAAIREAENASVGFAHVVEQLAKTIGAHSHADTIFGAPITRDGVTVVPVARVIGAFGAGTGSGGGRRSTDGASDGDGAADGDGEARTQARAAGGGGIGGGGGFMVSPVGLIEIRPEGARFKKLDQPLGAWGDVGELMLFLVRRGWSMLRRT